MFGTKYTQNVTGLRLESLKAMSPERYRAHIEAKNKKPLEFTTQFPSIGRGNVLHTVATTSSLNKAIDKILKM